MKTKTPRHPPTVRVPAATPPRPFGPLPPEARDAGGGSPGSGLDKDAFEKLVADSLDSLPKRFKELFKNVAVLVEDFPSPETMREMGLRSPYQLYGLYHGVPLDKRGSYYGNVPPDVVVIYRKPIENACRTEDEIREEVLATVIHEVGHFFGLGEAELRAIELETRRRRKE